jgi:hypothetical protein
MQPGRKADVQGFESTTGTTAPTQMQPGRKADVQGFESTTGATAPTQMQRHRRDLYQPGLTERSEGGPGQKAPDEVARRALSQCRGSNGKERPIPSVPDLVTGDTATPSGKIPTHPTNAAPPFAIPHHAGVRRATSSIILLLRLPCPSKEAVTPGSYRSHPWRCGSRVLRAARVASLAHP